MELCGERLIPASVDATWAALNDPAVLKACIAGCESLERSGDDGFAAVVALKVGPVVARFKGRLQMTNLRAPTGYTIDFDGQGGGAGVGKGSADVALTPEGTFTQLKYVARATIGGEMAQIGSRLIDATAAKITDDFFMAFEAHLQAAADPPAQSLATSEVDGAAAVQSALRVAKLTVFEPTVSEPGIPEPSVTNLWWLIGGVVLLGVIYVMLR